LQWESLSEDFADNEQVHVADVDCTSQRDVCSQHGIRGYPTLHLFSKGDAASGQKYAGGRDPAALKAFLESHSK
jgi:thioredoxin-like negative regulator of GroEL